MHHLGYILYLGIQGIFKRIVTVVLHKIGICPKKDVMQNKTHFQSTNIKLLPKEIISKRLFSCMSILFLRKYVYYLLYKNAFFTYINYITCITLIIIIINTYNTYN